MSRQHDSTLSTFVEQLTGPTFTTHCTERSSAALHPNQFGILKIIENGSGSDVRVHILLGVGEGGGGDCREPCASRAWLTLVPRVPANGRFHGPIYIPLDAQLAISPWDDSVARGSQCTEGSSPASLRVCGRMREALNLKIR